MYRLEMPELRPLPINTQGLSWWQRTKAWLLKPRRWEVVKNYSLHVGYLNETLMVPVGFIFDGASIPRLFWPLLNPTGILLIPAIFHDFAYGHHALMNRDGKLIYKNKGHDFYDKMFREISLQVNGIKTPDYAAWLALRLFGRFAYNKGGKKNA